MIAIDQLHIAAGGFALRGLSFCVGDGEYAVLMGRTGSGKTTLLETIAGLRPAAAGRIVLRGRDVTRLKAAERGIGYVPQDLALFPTMTVRQHLGFGPYIQGWTAADIDRRVNELAAVLGIAALLDRRPAGLSGGEAQRVALGRALAARPDVLLLDEPLSALDDQTRDEVCDLLETLHRQMGVATLHVTHSRLDARRLADRVLVVEGGAVRERSREEAPQ